MGDDDANNAAYDDGYDADNYDSDGNQKWCKVYDKDDFFTVLIQILLAILALGSLYIKRLRERPRRTFKTWFLDVSKQGFGACYAHVLNMMIASIISNNIRGDTQLQDQCAWYGLSYLIDTTLGLVLAIIFVRMLDYHANERDWVHLKHSGVYDGSNGMLTWALQVFAWIFILTIVKLIIYLFMWMFSDLLAFVGGLLFTPLQFNIHFELIFVMILFPGLLNVVYFWIADSFLKAKSEHSGAHENDDSDVDPAKKESLLESGDKEIQLSQRRASSKKIDHAGDNSSDAGTEGSKDLSWSVYQPMPWSALFPQRTSSRSVQQEKQGEAGKVAMV